VLSLPPSVRLFVATQPVDGRKGADSLMAIVRDVFGQDPLSGHLFIFFSKRRERIRVVYWDRNGFHVDETFGERPIPSELFRRRSAHLDAGGGRGAGIDRRGDRTGGRATARSLAASVDTRKKFCCAALIFRSTWGARAKYSARMSQPATITSPHAPDVEDVRQWLEKMVKAMRLVEMVVAVVALIARMRDINTDLTKRIGDLRRKRPRSETLGRLERQLAFMFAAISDGTKPATSPESPPAPPRMTGAKGRAGAVTPAARLCRRIWSVCRSPTPCLRTCAFAPSAARR
jgi:hypothetical protein